MGSVIVAARSDSTYHHEKVLMEMGEDITEDISGDKNDVTNKSHYQEGGCSS